MGLSGAGGILPVRAPSCSGRCHGPVFRFDERPEDRPGELVGRLQRATAPVTAEAAGPALQHRICALLHSYPAMILFHRAFGAAQNRVTAAPW